MRYRHSVLAAFMLAMMTGTPLSALPYDIEAVRESIKIRDYNYEVYWWEEKRLAALQRLECSNAPQSAYDELPSSLQPAATYAELDDAYKGTKSQVRRAFREIPDFPNKAVQDAYTRDCKQAPLGAKAAAARDKFENWQDYNGFISSRLVLSRNLFELAECSGSSEYDAQIEEHSQMMPVALWDDVPSDYISLSANEREIMREDISDLASEAKSEYRKCKRAKAD